MSTPTRAWVVFEMAVVWPVSALLIALALIPLALGFGLVFVARHVELRLRARADYEQRRDELRAMDQRLESLYYADRELRAAAERMEEAA